LDPVTYWLWGGRASHKVTNSILHHCNAISDGAGSESVNYHVPVCPIWWAPAEFRVGEENPFENAYTHRQNTHLLDFVIIPRQP